MLYSLTLTNEFEESTIAKRLHMYIGIIIFQLRRLSRGAVMFTTTLIANRGADYFIRLNYLFVYYVLLLNR